MGEFATQTALAVLRTRAAARLGLSALIAFALVGCTDAERAKVGGLGNSARVTCYSGGRVIFDDFSTGKVSNEDHSDGYYFRSQTTGRLVEIAGQCKIDYDAQKPASFKAVL